MSVPCSVVLGVRDITSLMLCNPALDDLAPILPVLLSALAI